MTYRERIPLFLFAGVFGSALFLNANAQYIQQGSKLVGIGTPGTPAVGSSVSLSVDGNTLLVGAPIDSLRRGAALVFLRENGVWSQQGGKLVGTNAVWSGGEVSQGCSVALSADGNTAIVGGCRDSSTVGAAWVFTRSGNVWSQQGNKLVGTAINNYGVYQGYSVAISGDGNTVIFGGPGESAAWVFVRSGDVWTEQQKLVGSGGVGTPQQGRAVALSADGNTAIVGGYDDNYRVGAAWVFTRSGSTWTQQGSKLVGTGYVGPPVYQAGAVALSADGNTVLLGGTQDNGDIGATWVFVRSGGVWSQQGDKLVGTGGVIDIGMYQGCSVSLSGGGDTAIVGSSVDNWFTGAAWVFVRSGVVWSQLGSKLLASDATGVPHQGCSVSMSGDGRTAAVGGYYDNNGVGAAWVYVNTPTDVTEFPMPESYELSQNFPNPFNPSTTIRYALPHSTNVSLAVYNQLGQQVALLVQSEQQAGWHEVRFHGTGLASGVYLCRLRAGAFAKTKRILLVR